MSQDHFVPLLDGDERDRARAFENGNGNGNSNSNAQNGGDPLRWRNDSSGVLNPDFGSRAAHAPSRHHHNHNHNHDTNSSNLDSQEIPHSLVSFGFLPKQQQDRQHLERSLMGIQILLCVLTCICSFFSDALAIPIFQYGFLTFLLTCVCVGFGKYIIFELIDSFAYDDHPYEHDERSRDAPSVGNMDIMMVVTHTQVRSSAGANTANTNRNSNGSVDGVGHIDGDGGNTGQTNSRIDAVNQNDTTNENENGALMGLGVRVGTRGADGDDGNNHDDNSNDNQQRFNVMQRTAPKQAREMSMIRFFLSFIVPISLSRAIPAMDYFQFNIPTKTAYMITAAISLALITVVVSFVGYVQFMVWNNITLQRQRTVAAASASTSATNVLLRPQFNSNSNVNGNGNKDIIWMPTFTQMLASTLVFPIGLTALYQLIFKYSPIGAVGSPAMSSGIGGMDPISLQLSSIAGQIGVVFWMGWMASCAAAIIILEIMQRMISSVLERTTSTAPTPTAVAMRSFRLKHQLQSKQRTFVIFIACLALLAHMFGSLRYIQYTNTHPVVASIFNTNGIQMWHEATAPILQVSCLLPTVFKANQDPSMVSSLIERTNERLRAGDDLIMWSEIAVDQYVDPTAFDWPTTTNPGAVVAIAFLEEADSSSSYYNSMAIFQNGTLLGRYNKNHPVPVIEANVIASNTPPPVIPIQWTPKMTQGDESFIPDASTFLATDIETNGRIMPRTNVALNVTMAICFDFDFPNFIRDQAADVDLMIGPSEYWGSLGWNIWGDNTYRAVENGMTLFKCSNDGISGAVNPSGKILSAKPTIQGETYTTTISVQKGISTIYANLGGHFFGWVCLVMYPMIALTILGWSIRLHRQELRQHALQQQRQLIRQNDLLLSPSAPDDDD